MLFAIASFSLALATAQPTPSPAPNPITTTAPSTTADPGAASATPAPTPSPTPTPSFPQRDSSGIVWFVYDAGIAPTFYCAAGSECAIAFKPGERIKRSVTVKGAQDAVWAIQPSNPDEDETDPARVAHLYFAPLPGSPPSTIFIETTKHVYTILLRTDPRAIGYTYAFHIPDETNTVTLPIPIDRTYKYGTDTGTVTPIACPAHGYNQSEQRNPAFRPTGVIVGPGIVRIDFPPGTALPAVGAPTNDARDINHLTLLPTSTDFAATRRSIIVLACYPIIVLYLNTSRGRSAVILSSY